MQLTTDLSVRKWKPSSEGERVSCGSSVYVQGYSNGKRAYVFRAQPTENGKQKTYWVTLGQPATSGVETTVGGELDLYKTPVKSLGNLKTVGGNLNLAFTPIESLGDLTYVGGNLYLRETPISKKYTEREIRQMVNVKGKINYGI